MPSRREREEALIKKAKHFASLSAASSGYAAMNTVELALAEALQYAHRREDAIRALPFFAKDMDGEMEIPEHGEHGEWMRSDDVHAILDDQHA